jgi:hypothetical protein
MVGKFISNKLEMMEKEAVVAKSEYFPCIFMEVSEGNHGNISQDSRGPVDIWIEVIMTTSPHSPTARSNWEFNICYINFLIINFLCFLP